MRREIVLVCVLLVAACGPGGDDDACGDILAGDLVVTEVFADYDAPPGGSGADEGKEWFEIYNASSAPIDLEGVVITHARPDGSRDNSHTMRTFTIQPGEYAVLGGVTDDFVGGHLDYGYGADLGDLFNTDGGTFTLTCGSTEIDEASYDEVVAGRSNGFDGGVTPDFTANDDLNAWCATPAEAANEFEDSNFGTPGQGNVDCMVVTPGMCDDNGTPRATVAPAAGDLVITEVHPNPSGDDALQEWFEIHALAAVDLNGIQIARSTGSPDVLEAQICLHVEPGDNVVIAKTTEALDNGNLPAVIGTFGLSLVDTGDLRISDPAGGLIDAVTWTNADDAGSRQLDPDYFDATGNDDESVWCDSTTAWSGADLGSPGELNEFCAIPGMCRDGATRRAIVAPTLGQLAITEVFPNNTGADVQERDWIEVRAYASFDLNESQVGRTGVTPVVIANAQCIRLNSGDHALLAGSLDMTMNGGLTTVDAEFGFSFNQSGDAFVNDPTGTLLDTVNYGSSADGRSRQLDPGIAAVAGANTTNDDPTNWCNANLLQYNGTDYGTPRATNDTQCP